jgi:hypothetical protein
LTAAAGALLEEPEFILLSDLTAELFLTDDDLEAVDVDATRRDTLPDERSLLYTELLRVYPEDAYLEEE